MRDPRLKLLGKVIESYENLVEAIADEDWDGVIAVARVLFHASGLGKFIEPCYDPFPLVEGAEKSDELQTGE
jgi:hypothetical protein